MLCEHATGKEPLSQLPALVLLPCFAFMPKELGLHCAELAAVLRNKTVPSKRCMHAINILNK